MIGVSGLLVLQFHTKWLHAPLYLKHTDLFQDLLCQLYLENVLVFFYFCFSFFFLLIFLSVHVLWLHFFSQDANFCNDGCKTWPDLCCGFRVFRRRWRLFHMAMTWVWQRQNGSFLVWKAVVERRKMMTVMMKRKKHNSKEMDGKLLRGRLAWLIVGYGKLWAHSFLYPVHGVIFLLLSAPQNGVQAGNLPGRDDWNFCGNNATELLSVSVWIFVQLFYYCLLNDSFNTSDFSQTHARARTLWGVGPIHVI